MISCKTIINNEKKLYQYFSLKCLLPHFECLGAPNVGYTNALVEWMKQKLTWGGRNRL